MAQLLEREGFRAVDDPRQAEVLIVNTCGFIGPAREESLNTLRHLARKKRKRQWLIAAGCLTQRYGAEVARQVPGLDGILGTRRWMDIVQVVRQLRQSPHPQPLYHLPEAPTVGTDEAGVLRANVFGASAYLKIADGCRRPCAFCAIPLIKGPAVSRPPEAIIADARWLAGQSVQEIVLIAQDTTAYGYDLGLRDGLIGLLDRLVEAVPEVPWIRLMYAFPGPKVEQLAEAMARHPQLLHYLDLPLQHAHPDVLRRMRRPDGVAAVRESLVRLRTALPDLALRTTFLVGYPGETEAEFGALLAFVEEIAFDHVGVFTYSHEAGTPAASRPDDVPAEVKEERRKRLMARQQPISLARNRLFVGRTLDVLIEGQDGGLSVGRSYRDAPEIDGLVLVQATLPVGRIVPVRITSALEYDLIGEPA